MGHIPGIVTGGALGDIRLAMDKIGVVLKLATLMATVTIACLGIDDVAPVF
jgi:hypothetical protein